MIRLAVLGLLLVGALIAYPWVVGPIVAVLLVWTVTRSMMVARRAHRVVYRAAPARKSLERRVAESRARVVLRQIERDAGLP